MQQAIETAIALQQRRGDLVVISGERFLQVQKGDEGFRASGRLDLRMNRFQLSSVAADQDDVGAVAGAGKRNCTSESAAGAGNGDDAAGELGRGRGVISRVEAQM